MKSTEADAQIGIGAASQRLITLESSANAPLAVFGLVAEEVEKVNSDLVSRDRDGKPYTVRYEAVNAMLLNEFLKEHKTVQEQGATIGRLQKQIEALTETVQKVSAHIELTKVTCQTVLNNH